MAAAGVTKVRADAAAARLVVAGPVRRVTAGYHGAAGAPPRGKSVAALQRAGSPAGSGLLASC